MKDSPSSKSNELDFLTKESATDCAVMKDQSIEANNYQDIGIMVQESLRKTSDSECNT